MILLTYEELLILSESESLIVKEAHIPGYGGRLYKNRIAINQALPTQAEKSCVLAEEIGHHCTTTGNILDQSDTMNRKQEYRARLYGYNLRVGLIGIIQAYEACCRNLHEMAEYLDVPDDYLADVIDCYRSKYGQYVAVDNYMIYFIPQLAVMRIDNL